MALCLTLAHVPNLYLSFVINELIDDIFLILVHGETEGDGAVGFVDSEDPN